MFFEILNPKEAKILLKLSPPEFVKVYPTSALIEFNNSNVTVGLKKK